ncbi:toxin-antitoxin system, toxin component [Streptomyces caeruleatus]|uniref:Toxin-antitoxin system, toxin component n=1 Tax=Streptomyces caeruleatus TaxID=661399 RepID=A0A124I5X4_9ACTN|nr:DUF397 domain-containing protein [Streptomyces caeruleatus]KUN91305.1 toxin-antitoxin system, toxin component [Streptomyces caeruleatus]
MTGVTGSFQRSSYSAQLNECVEVAVTETGGRAVRDSKQHNGPLLIVSRDSWQAFLQQIV